MDFGLTPQQLAVISALSSGASFTAAAEQAGVHRNTITNWCRSFLPFQLAFADAQHDRALYYREKMESLIDLALQSLQQILSDPKTPPSVRLKAALAIINTASTPPAPKSYVTLDIEKIVGSKSLAPEVHNPAQPAQPSATPDQPIAAAHSDSPIMHNSAQPCPPVAVVPPAQIAKCSAEMLRRPEKPKVGYGDIARNAPCPCGSGKKYKTCCINKITRNISTGFVPEFFGAA